MIKAVFVTGSLVHGGAERHSITVMNRLAERGHECHAVYVKDDPSQLGRIRLLGNGTVKCLHATSYFDRHAVTALAAHIAALQPSTVVAANGYALMYSWLAARLARQSGSLVVTYHSTQLLGAKERLKMLFYRPLFWSADCAVFVCERQRQYCRRGAVMSRRNEVIYNGIDTDQFSDEWNQRAREETRKRLGFADTDYVVGISAVLRREKNHVQLVDAVAMLRGAGVEARALMIGDGEMRGAVESRARARGIEKYVVITGFQEEVRPYVAACDAMALCSLAVETFSLAAIESMAMCKPVVHSDVGGASEMIVPGLNGFLFPKGDTTKLADKLRVLACRATARQMGKNARERALALFSEKTMVDRYERLLLEVRPSGQHWDGYLARRDGQHDENQNGHV